jgi:hypothetical protein
MSYKLLTVQLNITGNFTFSQCPVRMTKNILVNMLQKGSMLRINTQHLIDFLLNLMRLWQLSSKLFKEVVIKIIRNDPFLTGRRKRGNDDVPRGRWRNERI